MLKLDHRCSGLDAAPVWLDPHSVKEEPGTALSLNQEPSRDGRLGHYAKIQGYDSIRVHAYPANARFSRRSERKRAAMLPLVQRLLTSPARP